jgi:transposase
VDGRPDEQVVLIAGVTVTVKVAHVRLCHSRMMFVRAYMRESQEMVFDAHDRAFAFFNGTCTRGIYDSVHCPPLVRGQWTRRRRWKPSSPARSGSTTAACLTDVQPLPGGSAVHWA